MPAPIPRDWPKDIERIGVADLDRLGIDQQDQLYWDGRRIEVKQRLALSSWQRLGAVAVTVFAILGGVGGLLSGLTEGAAFLCARNIHWLSCPLSPR